VIENMSAFTCEHGESYPLFGAGGGQALADEIGAALLGQVPIEAAVANGGDIGEPIVLTSTGPAAQAFLAIAANIMNTTVPVTEMGGCTARDPEAVQVAISKRS
jgi:ATP-binding protein involved in chromosome partitioning